MGNATQEGPSHYLVKCGVFTTTYGFVWLRQKIRCDIDVVLAVCGTLQLTWKKC